MTDTSIIITITTTERHTFVQGTTPDQHRELIADGFTYDRLAQQYRRSVTRRSVVDADGRVQELA